MTGALLTYDCTVNQPDCTFILMLEFKAASDYK